LFKKVHQNGRGWWISKNPAAFRRRGRKRGLNAEKGASSHIQEDRTGSSKGDRGEKGMPEKGWFYFEERGGGKDANCKGGLVV